MKLMNKCEDDDLEEVTRNNSVKVQYIKSDTDDLTQVGNRRIMFEYVYERIKRSDLLTLYFLDLDNFNKVNEIYGFSYGDEVLKHVANSLKDVFRKCLISRVCGDKFVVADCIKLDDEQVEKSFNLLKNKLKNRKESEILSLSMGVIDVKSSGYVTVEEIVARANMALRKSKDNGKNRYTIHNEEIEQENVFRLGMERDILLAAENNEIILFYQPKYTVDQKLKGFEALFRWNNEKYSKVPVYKIIQLIEDSDMILKVGEYVLEKAFKYSNTINNDKKEKLMISVNISPKQIMSEYFLEKVEAIIHNTKVDTSTIIFEITENLFIDNMSEGIKKLNELKRLGISISLDDFGTGYSSLSYLVKLPIDELKIDRSFIVGIESNDNYVRIIKCIAEIAHTLDLVVVAEGIEEQWQLEIMKQMGIDLIQGYLFGKPMAEEDASKLIK